MKIKNLVIYACCLACVMSFSACGSTNTSTSAIATNTVTADVVTSENTVAAGTEVLSEDSVDIDDSDLVSASAISDDDFDDEGLADLSDYMPPDWESIVYDDSINFAIDESYYNYSAINESYYNYSDDSDETETDDGVTFQDFLTAESIPTAVIDYMRENSGVFLRAYEENYEVYNIAKTLQDLNDDGEDEVIITFNYGRSSAPSDILICSYDYAPVFLYDNQELTGLVGTYYDTDPLVDSHSVDASTYWEYRKNDFSLNADNVFITSEIIGSKKVLNSYYKIAYSEESGYSIDLIRSAGWSTYTPEEDDTILWHTTVDIEY